MLLLELASPASSCGEGSRLRTAGEEGLLGTLSGSYGLNAGMAFLRWRSHWRGRSVSQSSREGSEWKKDIRVGGH